MAQPRSSQVCAGKVAMTFCDGSTCRGQAVQDWAVSGWLAWVGPIQSLYCPRDVATSVLVLGHPGHRGEESGVPGSPDNISTTDPSRLALCHVSQLFWFYTCSHKWNCNIPYSRLILLLLFPSATSGHAPFFSS